MADPDVEQVEYSENGYSIEANGDIATITLQNGQKLEIEIPGLSDLNLDSSPESHDFHGYVRTHAVGVHDQQSLWGNLRKHAAPGRDGGAASEPVQDYSETTIPKIGTVSHFVNNDDRVLANITQEGHLLHPGIVVRFIHEDSDGQQQITTVGIGNGLIGERNVNRSDQLWGENAYFIGGITALERDSPNIATNIQVQSRILSSTASLTKWYEANGQADFSSLNPENPPPIITSNPSSFDASIQWTYEYLKDSGIPEDRLNNVFSADDTITRRDQVTHLYRLSEDHPELQTYLQNLDYHLAVAEIVQTGEDLVVPIAGTKEYGCEQPLKHSEIRFGEEPYIMDEYGNTCIDTNPSEFKP